MKPIIVVVGATGGQGGSVISSFLSDGQYAIRGITRNVSSPKSLALQKRGVEMVVADLNDVQSLIAAFKDATAIYAVTDYFEPFISSGPSAALATEVMQGKNLATAAASTPSLKHYIWSTLPNAKDISNGKWVIPHFEGKNVVDAYIQNELKDSLWGKTTFLWVGFYGSNLMLDLYRPTYLKTAGKYVWLQPSSPNTPIAHIGDQTTNIGPFVLSIISQPTLTLPGKFVFACAETMTQEQTLEKWSKVTGKQAVCVKVDLDDFEKLFGVLGREMGEMMIFWEEAGEKSWSGEEVLMGKDLGVETGSLVSVERVWEGMDWDA